MKKLLFPVITLTLILLMVAAVSASAEEIWTIGTDNDSRSEFLPDSNLEILYIVGTSSTSDFPGFIDKAEVQGPSYVEIEFTTTMPYSPVTLFYGRAGAEKNELYLDGVSIGDCSGTEGLWSEYTFPIDKILPGTHTLKIECLSGGNGRHLIDWLQLSGNLVEPEVETSYIGPDSVNVGQLPVPVWTITIEICGDDEVDLNNVVVQGGIGADLLVTNDPASDVTQERKGKKGKGATIVRWDIGDLEAGSCLTLELTVETGVNPQGKQEFTSAELGHELDGGFSATYWYGGMEYETPETEPLTVDVVLPTP